ncbi:uncharacterized protein SETTUDRAFT_166766 [Exserohilum turcica Et28A]|uniref:Zn(2)-C6 fungal-type domain-containing protein n=1 Tax=Exserohilum turcicum (strain 28A) TaxID=671987 RepID=R0KST8_EXST2|nr:uncharacterized protein SETTUDRAFT_166766 [Exserohilum turcica Et28A]EOA90872.1 hypothetical protein SETTUDRAFT_166766 [Exserohilum turcica Et28A]
MSAPRSKEHLRLALEIRRNGLPAPVPCDYCFANNRQCVAMPEVDGKRLKCSECTRLGHPCVNMSWVDEDEQLLAQVISRLMRNKRILKQAEERAAKKTMCLANSLRAGGDDVDAQESLDCPAADALVGFSPVMWSTLGSLDALASPSNPGDALVFSS